MRAMLAAVSVLCLAGAASAATLKVPQQYATIQEAADAAADGDTILISKGVYEEHVVTGAPNLRILGRPGAVIDGTVGGDPFPNLTVNGAGTTVQGLTFRNGTYHVTVQAAGCRVLKCVSIGSRSRAIFVNGVDATQVVGCRVRGAEEAGIYVQGSSGIAGVFSKNDVRQCGQFGIAVYGAGALVERNTVRTVLGQAGIFVSYAGTGAVVSGNRVNACGNGIVLDGPGATLEGNSVSFIGSSPGITVLGGGALVSGNQVRSSPGGIECQGDGGRVLGNQVTGPHGESYGIRVGGDGITVSGNTVTDGHYYSVGFQVVSQTPAGGGTIEDNTADSIDYGGFDFEQVSNLVIRNCRAINCGAQSFQSGIHLAGSGNTMEDCLAQDNHSVGFLVDDSGNTLTDCVARGNDAFGFIVQAAGNTLNGCSASGSGAGLLNGGTGTVVNGGVFKGNREDVSVESESNTFSGGLEDVEFGTGGESFVSEIYFSLT